MLPQKRPGGLLSHELEIFGIIFCIDLLNPLYKVYFCQQSKLGASLMIDFLISLTFVFAC